MSTPAPALTLRQTFKRGAVFLPVFAIVLLYTYVYFFELPYPGFEIAEYRVAVVYPANTQLLVGDLLTKVGNITVADFEDNVSQLWFSGIQAGSRVDLEVTHNTETPGASRSEIVQWEFTGATLPHVLFRFIAGHWLLAYIFLIAGALTLWRPTLEDELQKVLAAFFLIMAIVVSASAVAWWHVRGGALLMRVMIWIALPIYLHLHWIFPKPFTPLHSLAICFGYAASVAAAFAELFRLLPANAYKLGFAIAMLGSLLLLSIRFSKQRDQQRYTILLIAALLIPSVSLGITSIVSILGYGTPLVLLTIGFYAQGILPVVYGYVSNRGRPGYFETQFNQITAVSLFVGAISLVTAILIEVLTSFLILSPYNGVTLLIALGSFIFGTTLGVYVYPGFKQIIERDWLGVPVSPTHIVETFAASVIRIANVTDLANLLRHTIVPSLVIHQSALMIIEGHELKLLYHAGLTADELPAHCDSNQLNTLSPDLAIAIGKKHSWAHLILPIKNNNQWLGVWLLGKHGAQDSYGSAEIATLKALANFIAVAISQIIESRNLRALYKADMDRHEDYRASISRELHDNTSQLKLLKEEIAKLNPPPEFFAHWDKIMSDIRHAITDLRPKMLDYGVGYALRYLRDQTEQQANGEVDVVLTVRDDVSRYNIHTELHIYRIIQQACENALLHAHAATLTLSGTLEPTGVDLTVEDNGVGFPFDGEAGVAAWVENQRFGIVGMHERAGIIHASLNIDSAPGRGTRIHLKWQP